MFCLVLIAEICMCVGLFVIKVTVNLLKRITLCAVEPSVVLKTQIEGFLKYKKEGFW